MKPFIQDGHTLVLRAVRAALGDGADSRSFAPGEAGVRMIVESIETTEWASATFVGQRHRLELRLEGGEEAVTSALDRLERGLPEVEVATGVYFLADAALARYELTLGADAPGEGTIAAIEVEALTIEA